MKTIKYHLTICLLGVLLLTNLPVDAREKVYVSTDKEYYLAGEAIWCSVYCRDENAGQPATYSSQSNVAYLEFYNKEGLAATIKTALTNGRGCGRFEIPFTLPTGNYSIVAYTKQDGGDSRSAYKGKIVSIFNTLTNARVKDGVEIVTDHKSISVDNFLPKRKNRDLSIEITKSAADSNTIPIRVKNNGNKNITFNLSIYHTDPLTQLIGENGYDRSNLLDRTGDFAPTGECEYEGEIIRGKIRVRGGDKKESVASKTVMMSAMGGKDDLYICQSDSLGNITYYTGNIYGQRDLVFDVVNSMNYTKIDTPADSSLAYSVELTNKQYNHQTEEIPILKISPELYEILSERSIKMQIAKRFASDTLFALLPFRKAPLLNNVPPIVYNLDEYTRFPLIEEVVREYMPELRIRKFEKNTEFQILLQEGPSTYSYSQGNTLLLLDGVPVRNHAQVVKMDPLLVKQVCIYPRHITINSYNCQGIVDFRTYKRDMGGLKLPPNINIINYKGTQYPIAFTGNPIINSTTYPNYNETIYWNPVIEIQKNKSFELNCPVPHYKGNFKIVIEGIDQNGNDFYSTATFSL